MLIRLALAVLLVTAQPARARGCDTGRWLVVVAVSTDSAGADLAGEIAAWGDHAALYEGPSTYRVDAGARIFELARP